jgi:hypothetical protein
MLGILDPEVSRPRPDPRQRPAPRSKILTQLKACRREKEEGAADDGHNHYDEEDKDGPGIHSRQYLRFESFGNPETKSRTCVPAPGRKASSLLWPGSTLNGVQRKIGREAIENHLQETRGHVERLSDIKSGLGINAPQKC